MTRIDRFIQGAYEYFFLFNYLVRARKILYIAVLAKYLVI